ncbi:MAG: hypothetical protein ACTSQY_11390 [Candidatus Odinarchaeia archaeon]
MTLRKALEIKNKAYRPKWEHLLYIWFDRNEGLFYTDRGIIYECGEDIWTKENDWEVVE